MKILPTAAVLFGAALLLAAPSYAGIGAAFGTRDPATCKSRSLPASGGPSAGQATGYLACSMEGTGNAGVNIYFYTNIALQVAPKGRSYNVLTNSNTGIDPTKPVYDIRGAFRAWQCADKNSVDWEHHPGQACSYEDATGMSGSCWRDTFADWHCQLAYAPNFRNQVRNSAPPK